jgi:hypothetical protein
VSTISATPDLAGHCRALLGAELVDAERIGAGRNSRVFRVTVRTAAQQATSTFVVKFYRHDPGDDRDRLAAEFDGLSFLWRHGVRAIARPVAADASRNCAAYEYIPGQPAGTGQIGAADIEACADFLAELKALRAADGSDQLPVASEACFSLAGVEASVRDRVTRLRAADAAGDGRDLHAWIDARLAPLLDRVVTWGRTVSSDAGIAWEAEIDRRSRTLSPSDFGFHNAIRRPDGTLAFVDFEYFGWDDPAKTIVDFLMHPGMHVSETLKTRFATRVRAVFDDVPAVGARSRIIYPLFGLKWCLIILNSFLPGRRGASSGETRAAQLAKAEAMADRVARQYAANPYLT